MSDDRPCTCPPMERPHPCARKFALSECKAATVMDPICYRWRHQKDEVWKYGHQPQHLVPPRGKEVIGYYIVQPLYAADAIESLQAECERLREELSVWKSVFPDIAPEQVLPDRAVLERDAARYRYAQANDLVGRFYRDVLSACYCEFEGLSDAALDAAMAQEKRDE